MRGWIIALIVVGVGGAIALGLAANSETRAEKQLCSSLSSLQSDLASLQNLDPSTTSQEDLQSDVSDIQSDWDDVKSDAQNLKDINIDSLEGAWNDFESAVQGIPDDVSLSEATSEFSQAAQTFTSSVQDTVGDLDCSSS